MVRNSMFMVLLFLASAYTVLGGGCGTSSGGTSGTSGSLLGTWEDEYGEYVVFDTETTGYWPVEHSYSITNNGNTLTLDYFLTFTRVSGSGDTLVGEWYSGTMDMTMIIEPDGDAVQSNPLARTDYKWEASGDVLTLKDYFSYSAAGSTLTMISNMSLAYTLNGDTLDFYGESMTRTTGNTGELEGTYEYVEAGDYKTEAVFTSTRLTCNDYEYTGGSWALESSETGLYTVSVDWIDWLKEDDYAYSLSGSTLTLTFPGCFPETYTKVD